MNSVMTKQFYKQRSDFEKSCVTRDEKLTFPDGVDFTENIAYADDNEKAHRLDIFRPQNAKDTMLPVIINVHGGGLLLGNKEFNRYFCALLCKKGFLVYSIEYVLL
jgi:acetyl esterase